MGKPRRGRRAVVVGSLLLGSAACGGGSITDVDRPRRLVLVDEHHNNGHTLETTYGDLAVALEEAGFIMRAAHAPFTAAGLDSAALLIVSNALADINIDDWSLPTPSAFAPAEIDVVREWVEGGGGLLFIADHMPFPGAAADLAGAFGVAVSNGFAFDTLQLERPRPCLLPAEVHVFRRSDGTLADHPVTNGGGPGERVDSVATFTGHAFDPEGVLDPLLSFGPSAVSIEVAEAWSWGDTSRVPVGGWLQGGAREVGEGRMAMLGEAAMFTTQECWNGGIRAMGWQLPGAGQNRQLLVNLARWLTRTL